MRRVLGTTTKRSAFAGELAGVVVAAVALLIAGFALGEAAKHGAVPFDRTVTRHLSDVSRSHAAFRVLMEVITFLGSTAWLCAVAVVTTVILLVRHAAARALRLLVSVGSGSALTTALKILVDRPRPPLSFAVVHATGRSFPSGHAMNSTILYGALVLLLGVYLSGPRARLVRAGAALLVVLIACSRLALGVHYFSDVVGGIALGTTWLLLMRPVLLPVGSTQSD